MGTVWSQRQSPQFSFSPNQNQGYQPPAPQAQPQPSQSQPSRPAAQYTGSFNCPQDFGFYPHVKSCDKYWACDNGSYIDLRRKT